jgi:predicted transcriptional regulator
MEDADVPLWKRILFASIKGEEKLAEVLKTVAQELGKSIKDMAEESDIPVSTLYKLSSSESDVRLSTLRKLINYIRDLELAKLSDEFLIGLITSRDVLDKFGQTMIVDNKTVKIREYLANTIEEEIILGVRAVQEGVKAIICGPIAANTLKKIVEIPVVGISFSKQSLINAISNALIKF